mgnify:CR=1 FL=1
MSLKRPIPTVPTINKGPELFVKAISLSASIFVQSPCSLKLDTILAPTGYPLIMPIIKGKAPSPGTLKRGLINLFKILPKKDITLVYPNNSVAIKNGKSDGTTEFAQRLNPFFADIKFWLEKTINNKVNKQINKVRILLLNFSKRIFNLFMDTPLIYIYIIFCIRYNKKISSRQKLKIMVYYVSISLYLRRFKMNNYENAKKILEKYNQQQIINIVNKMPEEKKQQLASQVQKIDFEEVKELYEKTFEDIYVDLEQLQPIRGVNPDKLSKEKLDEYEQIATKIIKQNKFAVATMAGGQGTRLRTSTPKGNIQDRHWKKWEIFI